MPLIGYSASEMERKYDEGCAAGAATFWKNLPPLLQSDLPSYFHLMTTDDLIGGVRYVVAELHRQIDRQQTELIYYKGCVARLDQELETVHTGQLHAQITQLTEARGRLTDELAELKRASAKAAQAYVDQVEAKDKEIARLDELVVKYETERRQQNAKR